MFTVENLKEFLKQASLGIADAKDMLTQLDAQAGDGDLGVNMEQGFSCGGGCGDRTTRKSAGNIFRKCGGD